MKIKQFLTVLMAIILLASIVTGCSAPSTSTDESADVAVSASSESSSADDGDTGIRTTEDREDALDGEAVTPAGMTLEGIDAPGVIPKKQYFIAFSNGEMGNSFCRTFVDDMESVANEYTEQFGIRYEWTNAGNNSTQQLSDIQSLISKSPDVLIVSPNEVEPLNVIAEWCEEAGIPLMIIDKELSTQPGEGTLISVISYDFFLQGVQIGVAIVDYLTEKYGEPQGDVAEIAGIMGASASIERSQGMNLVLQDYPDINVVVMRDGEWDNSISYACAQDILTTYPEGTIDVVVGNCDESCLAFMEAAEAAGRTDIGAGYVGADSPVAMLEKILNGGAYATAENSPYYGYVTFEYAVRWLNGEDIPERIMLPNRFWRAVTDEQKAAMQDVVDKCTEAGYEFVPASYGYYDVFEAYPDEVLKYYSVPLWQDRDRYADLPYYETTESTIR